MAVGDSETNKALLECLAEIRPENLSWNAWIKAAGLGRSTIDNWRKGGEPNIYKLEKLLGVAGVRLSAFWKKVEVARKR